MNDPVTVSFVVGLAFVAAGFVKGVVGMGLPTVAMGLLGLVMAPAAAAALLVLPSLVTNLWQLLAGPSLRKLLPRLATLLVGVVVGTWASIGVLTGTQSRLAPALMGAVLAIYGVVGLRLPKLAVPRRAEPWLSPLIGLITGLVTGATGIFVIPAVPYLGALGLEKEELIQALGLSFTVSSIALGAALMLAGSYAWSAAGGSLLAVVPALLGMFIGQRIRGRLAPPVFKRWFFIGLVVLGLYMLARALWQS